VGKRADERDKRKHRRGRVEVFVEMKEA